MKRIHFTIRALGFVASMLCAAPLLAGGPLAIYDSATRTPYAYAGPVSLYTDNDPFFSSTGPVANADADARVADGIAEWTNVPSATFSGAVAGDFASIGLPDIDFTNVFSVINTFNDGGYHIIYDSDGFLTFLFTGSPFVLGFSGPEWAETGTPNLIESWAVMNGSTVDAGDVLGTFWQGVFTHEFGHGINLAHTQTNGAIGFFGDHTGPTACVGGCPTPYAGVLTVDDLETMYPFLDTRIGVGTGVAQGTVDLLDDISALSNVYPAAGWPSNFGTITGKIFTPTGSEVSGVNVIARNVADPFGDCISALSGDFTHLFGDGLYTFNGLTPGADYVVYVDRIVAGGFSTAPASPFPGAEEFFNGASESNDPDTDDACDAVPIAAAAGVSSTADITFNSGVVALSDDDFAEVPLPFVFSFCGNDYTSVFVGSNGFLTFGAGDNNFFESVSGMLNGPPRIAAWWDDLNPSTGGCITEVEVAGNFVITWNDVPEYPSTGANTFSVTLRPDGTHSVDYGAMTSADGIAGTSPGGVCGVFDPGGIDLSVAAQPIQGPACAIVYEQFTTFGNPNDLAGASLDWEVCPACEVTFDPAVLGTCYASTGAADGGRFLTLDLGTGAGALVGNTGISTGGAPGLAIDSQGQIYVTDRIFGDLYRIDPATGAACFVAPVTDADSGADLFFIDGIAFDENDVLYGVEFAPPSYPLRTIDTTTGISTVVGATGDNIVGLAFDPTDGQLYGSGGACCNPPDRIYRIDKATGQSILIGTTGLGGATPDLVCDADGNLYGTKPSFSNTRLISIDKCTAQGTVVGIVGFGAVSGLASYLAPSPPADHTVAVDIKPESCPNAINSRSGGTVSVAILGSEDLDVSQIDASSISLSNCAFPVRWDVEDVATAANGEGCDCTEAGPDGFDDLVLKFDKDDLLALIYASGETTLSFFGQLVDGSTFAGSDCATATPVGLGRSNAKVSAAPQTYFLAQNRPNPFNPATTIEFGLPEPGRVELSIYNLRGQLVRRLVASEFPAGRHEAVWDGRSQLGVPMASGIYFYWLKSDTFDAKKRLVLLR